MTLENTITYSPFFTRTEEILPQEGEDPLPWQLRFSCAPAVAKHLFNISGINLEMKQEFIRDVIYDKAWDGTRPIDVVEFYKWYYRDVVCIENASLDRIREELAKGKFVEVLWQDDLPEDDPEEACGHWTSVAEINDDYVLLRDPSNARRVYDSQGFVAPSLPVNFDYKYEKRKTYKMKTQDFLARWFDTVDESGRVAKRLAIFVDPYNLRKDSII